MSEHCRNRKQSQGPSQGGFPVRVSVPMLGALVRAGGALQELCVETGRQVLMAMMEADREALCGPKGRHDPGRRAHRAGSVPSRVTLGGPTKGRGQFSHCNIRPRITRPTVARCRA